MASGQERILKRRIRSVQSTKKITRAMELIAASRIVRAQQRVAAARPYSEQITEVIHHLAAGGTGLDHPLLREPEAVSRAIVLVVTADRGLAGAYNSAVIRAAERLVDRRRAEGADVTLVAAGRKALSYFRYRGYPIAASYQGFSEQPAYQDAAVIARDLMRRYEEGELDQVELVYTRFLSLGTQRVVTVRLLPLEHETITERPVEGPQPVYEMEPAPEVILDRLLPRYVEARLYAALLDAAASEHAARQRAMKSATDNAEELIHNLSIVANKARQAAITTEIMEIVGGAEALRQASE
jgi:F-type H+-transporting ATPase subunit gamma